MSASDASSERQREGLDLRQSQKLEAIGHLAAGIAHEINTPLQYVSDNVRFLDDALTSLMALLDVCLPLAREHASGAQAASLAELEARCDLPFLKGETPAALAQAQEGLARVSGIVRALRALAHPGSDDPVPTDLNALVENVLLISRNEWKYVAELTSELDRSLPSVPCVPGMISQALLGLVVNAAQAMVEEPRAEAKPSAPLGRLTVRTRRDGEWVELTIADTGCGIPREIQHRLFEPFFTTRAVGAGTGQGLAIARAIVVEKHRGTIAFASEPGRGTTFTVRLPLAPLAPSR